MKNPERAGEWLKRAKSNLAIAGMGPVSEEVLFEDLCFETQQAVEKALKALCIAHGIVFQKTHDIAFLLELLEKEIRSIPEEIDRARLLTDYAVAVRYPGAYEEVTEAEYIEALEIAETVLGWVEKLVGPA